MVDAGRNGCSSNLVADSENLRAKLEELEVYFQSSLQLLCIADTDGYFHRLNPQWQSTLGYGLEELEGKRFLDFVHPDDHDSTLNAVADLAGSRDVRRFRNRYRHRDGSYRWLEWSSRPSGNRIYAVATDITQQVEAEEQLRQSEERFRTLFEAMEEGFALHEIICDRAGNPVDYRFVDVNPAFERFTGLSREQIVGKTVREVMPGTESKWIEAYGSVALTGQPLEMEEFSGVLNRYYRVKAYSPGHGKFAVVFEDVTGQKRVLRDLLLREEQLKVLIESSQAGIIMVSPSGVITAANGRMAEMFACSREGVIGARYPDFVHPDQRECGDNLMVRLIRGEIDHVSTERHYLRRDGTDFWGFLSGRRHEDSTGNLISLVGHITDITELKRAEAERIRLEQQLLHTQKLESLGVLAGGIAHDFNNLLTAIVGNADIALMRLNPESPVLENLQRIEKAAARATDLAKQMLAYSGRGKFVVEPLDLNRLVEEMGHMLQVSISKKVVLRFNLTRPLPAIEADATQVRQVVMNLVINAAEAIGDRSGVVAITTGCLECDRRYLSELLIDENIPEGLYVFLEVADTGCGMDRDTMSKIFDPFFTTKFTGRGLGMAAVLGIVRGHRGAIRVYSEPAKGSTFKILFPAGERPAELFNGDRLCDDWRGGGAVLLVDDEETVRAIGSEMLRQLGFEVVTAADGREALARYQERNDWQFVLLDLTMPHLDGEQSFRELRKIDPRVRVIIASGYNEQEVTQRFLGKGLVGFIQKPYKLSTLAEVIRKVVPGTSGGC